MLLAYSPEGHSFVVTMMDEPAGIAFEGKATRVRRYFSDAWHLLTETYLMAQNDEDDQPTSELANLALILVGMHRT